MANEEGQDIKMISAALMAASGVYATFMAAGNQGFLAPNGIDRVAEVYKNNLAYIQQRKKTGTRSPGPGTQAHRPNQGRSRVPPELKPRPGPLAQLVRAADS